MVQRIIANEIKNKNPKTPQKGEYGDEEEEEEAADDETEK